MHISNVTPHGISVLFKLLLVLISALLFCPLSIADNSSEQQDFNNLLKLLSQQTTLATNTHLNADFVPGIINIMTGDEMKRKGFLDLWQVMGYMPGVQRTIDSTGMRTLTIRGISQSIGSGKIKLLLNNVTLNSSSSSTTGTFFDTPVNQIDRLEFIRGPGSAIHGEFAFAGVINVITKKQGENYTAGIGSDDYANIHALKEFHHSGGQFKGSLNFAASQTNGEKLDSGTDRTATGVSGYAPGQVNNKKDSISAIIDLQISDLNLSFQYQQSNRGDHFGINNYLPPSEKMTVISDTVTNFKIGHSVDFSNQLSVSWSLSHLENDSEKNSQFLGVAETFGGTSAEDDIVSNVDIEEQRSEAKINLIYRLNKHKLLTEFSYIDLSINQYQQFINLDPDTLLPDSILNEFPTPINRGQSRKTSSIVLQDEYEIDESRTITAGIRYDHYDDIGDNLSPRVAFVWLLSQQDIVKFQYAEAFRPPILLEVNGAINSSIAPEIIKTTELSYIHDKNDFLIKNTLYTSKIEDLIAFQNFAPFGYGNFDSARISGYEVEVSKKFGTNWDVAANLTLQDSKQQSSALKLYELAPWLLSISVDYQYSTKTSLNFLFQNIPEAGRETGDNRSDLPSTMTADFTLTQKSLLGYRALSITGSVKNISAEEIKFASPINTYPNDYVFSDSPSFWIEITYRPE